MDYKIIIKHILSALMIEFIAFAVLRSEFFNSVFMPKCSGYECMSNAVIVIIVFAVIATTTATVAAVATYKKSDMRKKTGSALVLAISLSPLFYILFSVFG